MVQIYGDLQHKPHAVRKLMILNDFVLTKIAINPCSSGNFWLIL